jgi:hypothetical protein
MSQKEFNPEYYQIAEPYRQKIGKDMLLSRCLTNPWVTVDRFPI